jgi:hypothetical protein
MQLNVCSSVHSVERIVEQKRLLFPVVTKNLFSQSITTTETVALSYQAFRI